MKKLKEILGGVIIGTLLILILIVYLVCYNINKNKETDNKIDEVKAYIYIMNDNTIKKSEIDSDSIYKDKYKGKYLCHNINCDIYENDIINPMYDDKYIILKEEDKIFVYNYIDNIKSNIYDNIITKIDSFLVVSKDNKQYLIDINGKEVINTGYDKIDYIYNNLVRVLNNDKYGIYDINNNKLLIDTKYTHIDINDVNYFTIKEEDKYYVIDKYDNILTDKYTYIFAFNKGYIAQIDNNLKFYKYNNTTLNDNTINITNDFKIERNGNKITITTDKEYIYDINRNIFR